MARIQRGATRRDSGVKPVRSKAWVRPALLITGLVIGAGWLLKLMMAPGTLPVTTIRVESPLTHLTQEEIRTAVRKFVIEGFLTVDMDAVQNELESLPWVASASVRRGWPDLLLVQIEEKKAVARWSAGGLLNERGDLFVPTAGLEQWQGLPLLRGPKKSEQLLMQEYLAMQEMLAPLGVRISHLTMNERHAWSLNLESGLQLRLGRQDMHPRLLRFVRAYTSVVQPKLGKVDSIDLRYTNGFAVRWRDGHPANA